MVVATFMLANPNQALSSATPICGVEDTRFKIIEAQISYFRNAHKTNTSSPHFPLLEHIREFFIWYGYGYILP